MNKKEKAWFTAYSEKAKTEIAKDRATLRSEAYTNMIRAKIHVLIEDAIK